MITAPARALTAHVMLVIVEERYRELARRRAWYRTWAPEAHREIDRTVALVRELVRIRWAARRSARAGAR